MLQAPGFPRRIGGKYRFDALLAWEERELLGLNTPAAPVTEPVVDSRAQVAATRPQKPVPTIPARKRPGRKAASDEAA
jgi:hypothetical protein